MQNWCGGIGVDKKIVVSNGLTFEITLPSEPDAYGGWWISVYDESLLNTSRATDQELAYITVSKERARRSKEEEENRKIRLADIKQNQADQSVSNSNGSDSVAGGWTGNDIDSSRPSGGGGDVYVKGYYRSNGTYVAPYTRSSPGTGRGGGGHR